MCLLVHLWQERFNMKRHTRLISTEMIFSLHSVRMKAMVLSTVLSRRSMICDRVNITNTRGLWIVVILHRRLLSLNCVVQSKSNFSETQNASAGDQELHLFPAAFKTSLHDGLRKTKLFTHAAIYYLGSRPEMMKQKRPESKILPGDASQGRQAQGTPYRTYLLDRINNNGKCRNSIKLQYGLSCEAEMTGNIKHKRQYVRSRHRSSDDW